MVRGYSVTTALLSAGVENLERAKTVLTAVMQASSQIDPQQLISDLSAVSDPDLALLSLGKIYEADGENPQGIREILAQRQIGPRTLKLLGASEFFGNYLCTHLHILEQLEVDPQPHSYLQLMLDAVGASNLGSLEAPCWIAAPDADPLELRRVYYEQLARIAAFDLSHQGLSQSEQVFPSISWAITDLVDATLSAALALCRRDFDPEGEIAFCVIAMGKTGARELNYLSDVDVIYIAQPRAQSQLGTTEALAKATQMAIQLGNYCSQASSEPALWVLDTALRPEGKDGALVRTLESHLDYYQRWAKTWEFQALLKARHCAGDCELSREYLQQLQPKVWNAVEREGFVDEIRQMRRTVESHLNPLTASREIKLGVGGLRDVEFTVQLLQLVHGRTDESLRVADTLSALRALSAGGYIGRNQSEELIKHYSFLRVIEHRTQLYRMQRTHQFPTGPQLRRVARSIDAALFSQGADLEKAWGEVRTQVRNLHEEIYYRPLLPDMAKLSAGEAALDEAAAISRLQAIGYRAPRQALEHITALTSGVSRRAAIQRQLLPVLLGWFADGVDPDGGLLAFRQVSDALGDTHWYLRLLRDSGTAAQRLTRLLSSSPLVAALLARNPNAVQWLDDNADLRGRSRDELLEEIKASFERQPDWQRRNQRLRAIRGREILRCAMSDVLNGIDAQRGAITLTELGEAVLCGALEQAIAAVVNRRETPTATVPSHAGADEALLASPHNNAGLELRTRGIAAEYLVVAMGRFGGEECGYATDADVVFYYLPTDTSERGASLASEEAKQIVASMTQILSQPGLDSWQIDTDLRPEGKAGAPAKDLRSLKEYLNRWAAPWERQALLRARPIVGAQQLRQEFEEVINPCRYETPPEEKELKEIRRLKARMETERVGIATSVSTSQGLASGGQASRQVKLGPGGLSDVEWCVQLLQMEHAREFPQLRTTGTRSGLRAACQAGLLSSHQTMILDAAWVLATKIRAANVLGSGRTTGKKLDTVATDRLLETTAALLGYSPGNHQDLVEDWLRSARQARVVVEQVFYRRGSERS